MCVCVWNSEHWPTIRFPLWKKIAESEAWIGCFAGLLFVVCFVWGRYSKLEGFKPVYIVYTSTHSGVNSLN